MVILTLLYFSSWFHLKAKMSAKSSLVPQRLVWFNFWKGLFLFGPDRSESGLFPPAVSHWPKAWAGRVSHAVGPLTKEMFWRSWCCHEDGDTLEWHTESLRPCWCKLSRGYSCAAGSNIRPHLEDQTVGCDWQAWRVVGTSLFPSYRHDNHVVAVMQEFIF